MKNNIAETIRSLLSLFSFMFCYLLAVVSAFFVLPEAAIFVQAQYDSLPGITRLTVCAVLLLTMMAALIYTFRSRGLKAMPAILDSRSRP